MTNQDIWVFGRLDHGCTGLGRERVAPDCSHLRAPPVSFQIRRVHHRTSLYIVDLRCHQTVMRLSELSHHPMSHWSRDFAVGASIHVPFASPTSFPPDWPHASQGEPHCHLFTTSSICDAYEGPFASPCEPCRAQQRKARKSAMCSAGGAGAYHDRYDTAAKNEEIGQHEGFQREGVSSLCFLYRGARGGLQRRCRGPRGTALRSAASQLRGK
jgi:hypothetical protein